MIELDHAERYHLLHLLLDMGEAMICSGSEVSRVEDTLRRMGKAYGAKSTNVFTITSSIVLTLHFSTDHDITESRRIYSGGGTNFLCLEKMNALSRRCCADPIPLPELDKEIRAARLPIPCWQSLAGSVLGAGAFAVFFGGTLMDGVIAALVGLLICMLQTWLESYIPNKMSFNLVCAFLSGLVICLLTRLFPILNLDKIIIGDIMLLIPGIAITNAVRDIMLGDTLSGILRLIESLLWATGLAVGIMLAIWLTGGAVL